MISSSDHVTIRDLDPANPSYVNGLPASERTLTAGDRIRIGHSTFVLTLETRRGDGRLDVSDEPSRAAVDDRDAPRRRLHAGPGGERLSPKGWSSDLAGLMRVSAAISAVHGLVALERPLIELIVEVVPADRGAVILCGDERREIASALDRDRQTGSARTLHVSRPVIDRVLATPSAFWRRGPRRRSVLGGAAGRVR